MTLPTVIVYGDGARDDYEAINAHYNGKAIAVHEDGTPFPKPGARYLTSKTIVIGCTFTNSGEGVMAGRPNGALRGAEGVPLESTVMQQTEE